MKIKLAPAHAESALDAISKIKVKSLNSPAGYALAKNTVILNRVLKNFVQFRDEAMNETYPDKSEKRDQSSAKHAELTAKVMAKAHEPVDVEIHKLKMSALFSVGTIEDLTVITALDFLLDDDLNLELDVATPTS
jgi:hypothetical protein